MKMFRLVETPDRESVARCRISGSLEVHAEVAAVYWLSLAVRLNIRTRAAAQKREEPVKLRTGAATAEYVLRPVWNRVAEYPASRDRSDSVTGGARAARRSCRRPGLRGAGDISAGSGVAGVLATLASATPDRRRCRGAVWPGWRTAESQRRCADMCWSPGPSAGVSKTPPPDLAEGEAKAPRR